MKTLLVSERSFLLNAVLTALYDQGHEVVEIWCQSQPAKMKRRSHIGLFTRAPRCCGRTIQKHKIKVRHIDAHRRKNLTSLLGQIEPVEMLICAGSRIIFSKEFLDYFHGNAFNFHPALLPRYRGPHPRIAMALEGELDRFGGMSLHCLTPGIDEGDMIGQRHLPRSSFANAVAWNMAESDAASALVRDELSRYMAGELTATPQDATQASYKKLSVEDLIITHDWFFDQVFQYLLGGYGILPRIEVRVQGTDGAQVKIPVCGTPRRLGAPTGKPAAIRIGTIEIDLCDARARLQRETRWQRLFNRINRHRTIITG